MHSAFKINVVSILFNSYVSYGVEYMNTIQENWFTAKPIAEYGNYSKNGFTGFFASSNLRCTIFVMNRVLKIELVAKFAAYTLKEHKNRQ